MNGRLWKIGTRRGMAYVEGRENAQKVMDAAGLAVELPRKSMGLEAELRGAMAVYTDPKGKPFAWLIAFDTRRWEEVSALLPSPS